MAFAESSRSRRVDENVLFGDPLGVRKDMDPDATVVVPRPPRDPRLRNVEEPHGHHGNHGHNVPIIDVMDELVNSRDDLNLRRRAEISSSAETDETASYDPLGVLNMVGYMFGYGRQCC